MRVVDRYIIRELLVPFFLGIAVFTSLLLVARMLKLVEMVVNRGVPLGQVLRLVSYILPSFLEVTIPMALLLAILVAFGRLSSDSELVALQASGVGLYRLVFPVAISALTVGLLTLTLAIYARPWGNSRVRSGLYEIVRARASAGIKERVFNDDFLGLVLYVDRIDPPGNMLHGILISDTRSEDSQNTVFAKSGVVVTSETTTTLTLRLMEGSIYTASKRRREYQETRFSTYDIHLDLETALVAPRREREPKEMGLRELRAAIAGKRRVGDPALVERVELQRRFSIAFACLVFTALGVPLGVRPARAVHSRGFSISLVLIFIYYLLFTLGQNLGERGAVHPAIAVWLPNVLLSCPALPLLRRAARGTEPDKGPGLLHRAAACWELIRYRLRPSS